MGYRIYLSCLFVVSWALMAFSAQDVNITTYAGPQVLVDGETNQVSIRCEITGTATVALQFIRINFKKVSGTERKLAEVTGNSPVITDSDLVSRAEVQGQVSSNPLNSLLRLDITQNVSCVETGAYTCVSQYQDAGETVTLSDVKTITGESHPTELEFRLDPLPPTNQKYAVGTRVSLICSGKVGKPAQEWNWQKYNEETTIWEPYTLDVSNDAAVPVTDCAFSRSGRLDWTIPDDVEHKFRCTAGNDIDDSLIISVNGDVSGASYIRYSPVLLVLAASRYFL